MASTAILIRRLGSDNLHRRGPVRSYRSLASSMHRPDAITNYATGRTESKMSEYIGKPTSKNTQEGKKM